MKTKIIVLLSLLFIVLSIDNHLRAETTNTSFKEYRWVIHPFNFYNNVIEDTTSGWSTMLLETMLDKKGIASTLIPINSKDKSSFEIKLKIRYKTEDCQSTSVVVSSIGECENVESIDSIKLVSTNEWNELTHIINLDNTLFLNVSVEATGSTQNNGKIWISDLDIYIDNKKIEQNIDIESNIKVDDLIDINNKSSLPFLSNKILAIGETTHGTATMNDMGISLIKERILNHNSRIVLLEIPLEISFYINRYLNNDDNFYFEHISYFFENSILSESFFPFLEWIKEYNQRHDKKVYIFGFDINRIQLKSRLDLFDFFYTININEKNEDISDICKILLHDKTSEEIILKLENNQYLSGLLDEDELNLILYCMKTTQQEESTYWRTVNRDKYMYGIVKFILDNLFDENDNSTLFGHFGHLNYITGEDLSILNYPSLGYFLRDTYKNNYSCVALLCSEGDAMLAGSNQNQFKTSKIEPAPVRSLEYQIDELNRDLVYLPMCKFNCSDMFKLRFLGNVHTKNQFQYIIPKSRMDGAIFIKKSVSIEKSAEVLKKNLNEGFRLMSSYKEALDKMKNN